MKLGYPNDIPPTGSEAVLYEIKESLARIESLLQRLPEIQAATFLRMQWEYKKADPFSTRSIDPRELWPELFTNRN